MAVRVRRRSPYAIWSASLVVAIVAVGCTGGSSDSRSSAALRAARPSPVQLSGAALTRAVIGAQPAAPAENVAFVYQAVPARDLWTTVGRTRLVVAAPQRDEPRTTGMIRAKGAEAFRYVQTYWFPAQRELDGLAISSRPDLAFCRTGTTPAVGRTDSSGTPWYFLDANEVDIQNYYALKFRGLKADGWDGVFFDRGYASLTGIDDKDYGVWNRVSSCTDDPVHAGATFADSYLAILGLARAAGLEVMFNYGVSPFDGTTPLRPDPRDASCAARDWTSCRTLPDAWSATDWVLDEAVTHPTDEAWGVDFIANTLNERDPGHGGQVIGLVTRALLSSSDRDPAFYGWARARLFDLPVGVGTGYGGCAQTAVPCNRAAAFPDLVSVTLGHPVDPQPRAVQCPPGDSVHCVWIRRYERGVVVANVSDAPKTAVVQLGVGGCRYMLDVRRGTGLVRNRCATQVSIPLGAWSGGPIQYSSRPF